MDPRIDPCLAQLPVACCLPLLFFLPASCKTSSRTHQIQRDQEPSQRSVVGHKDASVHKALIWAAAEHKSWFRHIDEVQGGRSWWQDD